LTDIVRISNITRFYGKQLVLDSVSLDIEKGKIFGVIGLSGGGKTTLLKLIIGFLRPDEGNIFFNRKELGEKASRLKGFKNAYTKSKKEPSDFFDISKNKKLVNLTFGFASQEGTFYDKLTVEENIDYFASLYGVPGSIRARNLEYLIDITGLKDFRKKLADQLSEGMKKRLGIACAIVHNPSVLILDEPTADLDPTYRKHIWRLIKSINDSGTTIILASHLLDEVDQICDEIAILHKGKILIKGSPDELKESIKSESEVIVDTLEENYADLAKKIKSTLGKEIIKIELRDGKLVIYSLNGIKTMDAVIHLLAKDKKGVFSLQVGKPSITEVFELLVSK